MNQPVQVTLTVPISEADLPRYDPEETIPTAVVVSLIRSHPRICVHSLVDVLRELHPLAFDSWWEHRYVKGAAA